MMKSMLIGKTIVEFNPQIEDQEVEQIVKEEISEYRAHKKSIWKCIVDVDDEGYIFVRSLGRSPIKRIRRITGYLSEVNNFNDLNKQSSTTERCTGSMTEESKGHNFIEIHRSGYDEERVIKGCTICGTVVRYDEYDNRQFHVQVGTPNNCCKCGETEQRPVEGHSP